MTEEHRQRVDIEDELIKTIVHIDDGRDYTQRIIYDMRSRQYIHEGICPLLPPAPKVAAVTITPKGNGRNKRGRK